MEYAAWKRHTLIQRLEFLLTMLQKAEIGIDVFLEHTKTQRDMYKKEKMAYDKKKYERYKHIQIYGS
jgi:predicted ATPase